MDITVTIGDFFPNESRLVRSCMTVIDWNLLDLINLKEAQINRSSFGDCLYCSSDFLCRIETINVTIVLSFGT